MLRGKPMRKDKLSKLKQILSRRRRKLLSKKLEGRKKPRRKQRPSSKSS
jgi:hypothetical protein